MTHTYTIYIYSIISIYSHNPLCDFLSFSQPIECWDSPWFLATSWSPQCAVSCGWTCPGDSFSTTFYGHDEAEPIDWRYRFHIFLAYCSGLNFREYPHEIWPKIWYVYVPAICWILEISHWLLKSTEVSETYLYIKTFMHMVHMMFKPLGIILEDPQFDLWNGSAIRWIHHEDLPKEGMAKTRLSKCQEFLAASMTMKSMACKIITKFGLLKPDFSTFLGLGDKKRGAPHISKERWCSHAGHPVTGGTASSRCRWQGWWNEARAREHCAKKTQRPGVFHVHVGMSENGVYSQWNSHLVGIMISKTIGCRGTLFSDKPMFLW